MNINNHNPDMTIIHWDESDCKVKCTSEDFKKGLAKNAKIMKCGDEKGLPEFNLDYRPHIFSFSLNLQTFATVEPCGEKVRVMRGSLSSLLAMANHGLFKVDAVYITQDVKGMDLLLLWNFKRQICVAMRESIMGSVVNWSVVQAFKPLFDKVPENADMFGGIESVHHTKFDIYVFAYGVSKPWIIKLSALKKKLA